MNDVSSVTPAAAPSGLPDHEVVAHGPSVLRVPAQPDELPQGVLDLLAMLVVQPPSNGGAVQTRALAGEKRPERAAQRRLDLPVKAPVQPTTPSLSVTPNIVDTLADAPGPLPIEQAVDVPVIPSVDEAEVSINLYGTRPVHSGQPLLLPTTPTPTPKPFLEMKSETPVAPYPGLLQVPFNKGVVSGQVTVTRESEEPARTLLLTPSNGQVFDHLKAPFEHLRDPGWRLVDQRGEQPRQDTRQAREDEPQESPE